MLDAAVYEWLVWAVLAMLTALCALMLGTLIHHAAASTRLSRRKRRSHVLMPLLCRAVADPSQGQTLLAARRPGDRAVLLPLLLQLALDLRGEEVARISALAEKLGVSAWERRRLASRWATERSSAVKNLGLLRSHQDLPELLRMAKEDPVREVRLASAWAAGELGGRKAVHGLLELLDADDPGLVARVQEVLLHAAPDAAREIRRHAERTPSLGARRAAVELLGALRDTAACDLLLQLVDDPDPELRTKAVKAAAAIGDPRFAETFRRRLSDPEWPVRCQAATGLGAVGAADAIPDLRAALDDPAWWVRFNAASSLADLGSRGRAALLEVSRAPASPRRDVARYLLQRSGLELAA